MIEADHKQHQQHIFAELLPRMFLHKQIQEHRQNRQHATVQIHTAIKDLIRNRLCKYKQLRSITKIFPYHVPFGIAISPAAVAMIP